MGVIMNRVVLALIFYIIILPTGLVIRACGKDMIQRHIDIGAYTYRITTKVKHLDQLKRPF